MRITQTLRSAVLFHIGSFVILTERIFLGLPGNLRSMMLNAMLIATAFVSVNTEAVMLKIDANASTVSYRFNLLSICEEGMPCPPPLPPVFNLGGDIMLDVIPQHLDFDFGYPSVDRTLIKLKSSNLTSNALDPDFVLDGPYGMLGLMNGQSFEWNIGPCFLWVGPGSCSGFLGGAFLISNGTWDGTTLHWAGQTGSFVKGFFYDIVATTATVPEPGTLMLMSLILLMLIGRHQRSRRVQIHRSSPNVF